MLPDPAPAVDDDVLLDVIVVGAGFSGLGMAVQLQRRGRERYVVLERASDLGGTWRDNHYPGCACDIPSDLYSFSFAKNQAWSRRYAPQGEILAYLKEVARREGVVDHIRFNEGVVSAVFDEASSSWAVTTSSGRRVRARHLVFGTGALSRPREPALPGRERFAGPMFHTAQWRDDVELAGKRVAVVGSAASAIQVVPELQKVAAQVVVFQRTPSWILPKEDHVVSSLERGLKKIPGVTTLFRAKTWLACEARGAAFVVDPGLMRFAAKEAKKHLRTQVKDPALRQRLTPTYTPGCKRILLSNDWYPALQHDNVVVVDAAVASFDEGSVVDAAGARHDVDVVVFATGFDVQHVFGNLDVRGRGGVALGEVWRDGMKAYKGTHVAGFPNLSILMGPNTGLGHSSMIVMIEAQIRLVLDELDLIAREGCAVVDVTDEAMRAWNDSLQPRLQKTVWAAGCASWYLDDKGENGVTWPGFTAEFAWKTRHADRSALRLTPTPTTTTPTPTTK